MSYNPWGCKKSDVTEQLSNHSLIICLHAMSIFRFQWKKKIFKLEKKQVIWRIVLIVQLVSEKVKMTPKF